MKKHILFIWILLFNASLYGGGSGSIELVLLGTAREKVEFVNFPKYFNSFNVFNIYSDGVFFKNVASCPEPNDIKITGQTDNSISIKWQQFGGGSKWEVIVVPYGEEIPDEKDLKPIIVTTNMKTTVTGLDSGKAYTFYVRVICSDGKPSEWSTGVSVSTKVKDNDLCAGANNIPVNKDGDGCTVFTSGTFLGSTLSGKKKKNCGSNLPNTDVWFEFTPTSKSHVLSVFDVLSQSGASPYFNFTVALYAKGCDVSETPIQCLNVDARYGTKIISGLDVGKKHYIKISSDDAKADYFFKICISSTNLYVSPSGEDYTIEELVKDVLVKSNCDLVSNVKYQAGDGKGKINTVAYFRKKNIEFPYKEGIVLATHAAEYIPGPYQGFESFKERIPFWSGDPDLNNVINQVGGVGFGSQKAVAVLEFDFIPIKDSIKFEYLFVSDSFNRGCLVVCQPGGALFAAWLTDISTGVGRNLAMVPGTTSPIALSTIRDSNKSGASCASVNSQFYWKNFANDQDNPLEAPANYTGMTVPMSSETVAVKAGQKYRIKLAIADFCPFLSDASAVFFKGGSFDIGAPTLGEDLTIEGENALCAGQTVLLDSKLNPLDYIFQWKKDGQIMVGENGPTLEVTETGSYALHLSYKGGVVCVSESEPKRVEFFDDIIIENKPVDLEACKIDGVNSIFNLKAALQDITHSQVKYSFYGTKQDAEDKKNEFSNMRTLDNTKNEQVIWLRVQSELSYCYKILSFKIKRVVCELKLVPLEDIILCYTGDTAPTFDIGKYSKIVYHNAPGYKVTFHKSKQDATDGKNAIDESLLDKYKGAKGEVIWVRVTKESQPELFEITSFKLNYSKAPTVNTKVNPLYSCVDSSSNGKGKFDLKEKDHEVSFSVSGVNIFYYETEADANKGDRSKALPSYGYESVEKTIYARVESINSDCFSVTSFELKLVELPKLANINNVNVCNSNNTGYAVFDLLSLKSDLLENPFDSNLEISFHSSINDAELNIKPLGNFYNNVIPTQEIIYLRVKVKNSKCIIIKPIYLYVDMAPDIKSPSDFVVCDINENGIGKFDLTEKEDEIFEGLEKENYNILYYSTKNDANVGDPNKAIKDITSYTNLTSEYVWVRVSDKGTGCSKVVSIKLKVEPLPDVSKNIDKYIVCGSLGNEGYGSFDLNEKISEITGSKLGLKVEFYETKENAENKVKPIEGVYKNTVAHKQVVFVRVETVSTGCFVVLPLTLEVLPYPVLNLPAEAFKICTNSSNEVAVFNLLGIVESVLEDFNLYEYTFYETLANANNNINKVRDPDNYNNLKGKGSVWVRIVNKVSQCVAVYELKFETAVVPKIPSNLDVIVSCDTYGDIHDGFTKVDLTQRNVKILKDQPKTKENYRIDFYPGETDAEGNKNVIIRPKEYVNTSPNQTIWVRLTDLSTGCFSIGKINLKVNTPLELVKPSEISMCGSDLNNVGIETFDLTIREKEILGGTNVYGSKFEYYETEKEALDRVNKIKTPESYKNKKVAQSIWIVVENEFGCVSSVVLTLRVLPLPKPIMKPKVLEACETEAGKGVGKFDLSVSDLEIRNGDKGLKLTYFEGKQNAIDKKGAINVVVDNNAMYYNSKSKVIYVRVESAPTLASESCFVIVELELKVNPIPVFDVKPFVVCLTEKVKFYEFNLEEKIPEILGKRDKNLFSVKFFIDIKTANSGEDPLPLLYTNVKGTSQTIYVRLEDINTGCFSVKPLVIQIEDIVYVSSTESPKYFCDNNDGGTPINDGFTTIDLTAYNADILGDNNIIPTSELQVIYYASESDFNKNIPIVTPGAFVNTSSPQKIIAVVKSKDDKLYCQAQTSFEIIVYKRSVMLPIEGGYICENLETREVMPFIIDTKLDSNLYDFVWELDGEVIGGAKQPYYEAKVPGTYTVSSIDKKTGCESFNSVNATITKIDAFMITIDELNGDLDEVSEEGTQTITVNVETESAQTSLSNYEFALDDGDYQGSNIFYDVDSGEHLIWVRDITTGACAMSKDVSVMNYPKYFTPNGDGYNDTWNIKGLRNQPNAKIYIFDRFGKLLRQLDPSGEGWDGTYKGRPMPSTDYWFTVEYNNNEGNQKSYKGHFSLKR